MIQIEVWLFLAATAFVVLYRLAAGQIDIGEAQLNRLQWLAVTLGLAAYYVAAVIADPNTTELPDPGPIAAVGFGGSSLLYLVNKLAGHWRSITDGNGAA